MILKSHIFLIGFSGSGKSTSFRNMCKKHVAFINTEGKMLPFKKEGLGHYEVLKLPHIIPVRMMSLNNRKDISVIIIDGLTIWGEEMETKLGNEFSNGFDLYAAYNKAVGNMISKLKQLNKIVIITAIAEVVEGSAMKDGNIVTSKEFSAGIQGQKKRGRIEANFTVVFFSQRQSNGKYVFETNNGKSNTAKSPMGLFKEQYVDNDMNIILPKILDFYALPPATEMVEELTTK